MSFCLPVAGVKCFKLTINCIPQLPMLLSFGLDWQQQTCNDPLVSAHPTPLMRGVLGVPRSPET
ncbi:hypothetical protein, partial [Chromohalobacter canadensis]|uniref:hypothetical protein n=1 Tax=Chromohalobacter canadensis TaxID=141389 RepID=UPI0024102BDA